MSQIQQLIAERYEGLDEQIKIDSPFYLITKSGTYANSAQLGMSEENFIYAQNVWHKCSCGKEEYQLPHLGMLELVKLMPLQCLHLATYRNQVKDYMLRVMVFNGKTKKTIYFKYMGTEPEQKLRFKLWADKIKNLRTASKIKLTRSKARSKKPTKRKH